MQFDSSSAACIERAQRYFKMASVKSELVYISSHFKILAETITKLEASSLPLTESMNIFLALRTSLQSIPGNVGKKTFTKLQAVIAKNPGFDDVHK